MITRTRTILWHDDGIHAGKHWIRNAGGTWDQSADSGITGDWIIRITVDKEK